MSLQPGTRIGPYEISALVGVGGMGEVYRARDTSLNRDVAIKVLPESLADDPERLARFDREAQLLAALNVPAETMPLASLYLRVFLLSMPSILLYNFEAAIFRSGSSGFGNDADTDHRFTRPESAGGDGGGGYS